MGQGPGGWEKFRVVAARLGRDAASGGADVILSPDKHHPGPRRVWMGGSELQGLTPFPVDPVDPLGGTGEFQKPCFGATLHHFWLLWGPQNGPKACF